MSFILTYRRPKAKLTRAPSNSTTQEDIARLKAQHKAPQLLRFEDLPEWYQDNHFIQSGYRPVSDSWLSCAFSLGYIHNETVNIYTHLIPAVLFTLGQAAIFRWIPYQYPEATLMDHVVFGCNVAAAIVTMVLSASYHTLMNHSMHISNLFLRVDYVGILTLILGSFFSGIYVGFRCQPAICWTYWTMIITLTIITSVLVLHPQLQGLKYRSHRSWAFILTALSGFAPIIHGLLLYGWDEMMIRSGMQYYLLEGLVYGLGAFFFLTRIPESICSDSFDIWFSSHQVFHVLVVLASLVHLYGIWVAFDWNYQHLRICPATGMTGREI
ncbi:hemolysin-III related-domain-containing protein [Exophiala viscosa]|uniref:Hemolysin-III related-domain-containing protein n=1 Tax=Exophiala viscosa TaxID=2486360 RepID=A0AAN6E671_9EURO|nr:hemolysin-III related-domain-containing protein [Exophiala viscosa]